MMMGWGEHAGFLVPSNPFDAVAVRFDVAFFQVSLSELL